MRHRSSNARASSRGIPTRRRGWHRVIVALVLTTALGSPAVAEWPDWMERWLFNAEERTQRALDAYAPEPEPSAPEAVGQDATDPAADDPTADPSQPPTPTAPSAPMAPGAASGANGLLGDPERAQEALDPLETALRLAPEQDAAQFNAGTARLASEAAGARSLLESAAQSSNDVLASRASFNLGNANFADQKLPEAIEAYRDALRRDPTFEDAKFNLELAQRRLEEQQQEQQDQQQNPDQQNQDQQDDQNQQNQDQQDEQDQDQQDQENQDPQDQDQQDQDQQQDQEQQDQDQQQDQEQQDQQNQDPQDQEQQQEQQDQEQQQDPQQQQPQDQQKPLPQFEDLPDMTAEEAAAILEAIENMEREALQAEAREAARKNAGGKKDW